MPHPDPILARDRRRKDDRRFAAYLRSLDNYHPLFGDRIFGDDPVRLRPAWTERAWAAIVDPNDDDGPVPAP